MKTSLSRPQMNRAAPTIIKRLLKMLLAAIIIIGLVAVLAYAFRFQILTGLARLLVIDDPLQPADVIFVLNGDVTTRPFQAAELFKQDLAPLIVIAREEDSPASEMGLYPNGTDVSVSILQELGVPPKNIKVIPIAGGVTSTRDEAQTLRRYVEEHDIERVILITSAFHTRRAEWIFDKELSDSGVTLKVSAAPQWQFDETNWWQQELGLITLANEYIKLVYYFAVY